ncbi:MAG: ketoacyl-ACP synthase III [Lachnospiraceae bacterium]|nr:ketoacyl-ACP synthase III [Lachnospiraceae bacterium]
MRAQIIGTGSCLPEKIVTNDFLSTIVDTSDEWVSSRTGIRERHISIDETTVSLSAEAGRRAMEMAGVTADEIDLIIVATCTADTLVPSTACLVQDELNAAHATAFDINAACSGFVFALNLTDVYMQAGMYRTALVIGAETLSRIVDWKDRTTCVLFADGAGAAVVRAAETGVSFSTLGSDGSRGGAIYVKSRENYNPFVTEQKPMDFLYMDGGEVFKFAVKKIPEAILETLDKADLTVDDIDWFLLHQANARINQSIARKLKIPIEKVPMNVDHCGNTSGGSVPILLDEVNRKGMLKSGDTIVCAGFGSGLTWGVMVLTWA